MLNIVVPMAGNSVFFNEEEFKFPKYFIEVNGKPMIESVIENLENINSDKKYIFIINDNDAKKYRLDNVLKMLTKNNCEIIYQTSSTKGAVCSILLGIKFINNNTPLIVSNADQLILHEWDKIINFYTNAEIDGGAVCFNSVHPQWSYCMLDEENRIMETAEKEPISRNAIAGLYYFSSGKEFVNSAMKTILKDRNFNGLYYTSLVLNEMILENKNIISYSISAEEYKSFYSPKKIKEYEDKLRE